ncbi:t-SNARE affecting a late Golgi compartment protein 2 [Saxophila tyrrhenica]|uniref:t-SNARE affecting a late Golgi compartment protein 2 n=1 Tax=Saxophila tyrrhenica TaxID=1690608 RepID=A0AAV9PNN7_9PEZI|nr:t-SNARE affecting a late Golgi compartment protein 2 [Saxophila tyrrhenica]
MAERKPEGASRTELSQGSICPDTRRLSNTYYLAPTLTIQQELQCCNDAYLRIQDRQTPITAMTTAGQLGAWRDRTNLYISYRQSYSHHPAARKPSYNNAGFRDDPTSERAGLMSNLDNADGDAVIEMDLLPPRWLDIQDEITTHLSTIASLMKRLDTLHSKHVLPGFDDESVKAREEREIESLTSEITRGFGACQRAIKRVDNMLRTQQQQANSGGGSGVSKAEATMAKNLQISLATRVGDASTLFRKKQSAYLRKLRSLGGSSTPDLSNTRSGTPTLIQNPYTDPALAEQAADVSSAQSTLQQTSQIRRRTGVLDAAIEQREREIEKIAQGVIDLSTIFQELNSMVIDQGSLLDRIDYNVERTAEHVKAAEKELTVATRYQKKGTKRLVILLLILLVVGMFILLLVKPKKKDVVMAPGAPNPPGDGLPPTAKVVRADEGVGGVELGEAEEQRRRAEWKRRRRRGRDARGSSFMPV